MTITALIDADIFLYEFGSATDDEGHPLKWPLVVSRINERLSKITKDIANYYEVNEDSVKRELYITGPGNFREEIATILPYKGNRPKDKPHWYKTVKQFLIDHRKAIVVEGEEADDRLGIRQTHALQEGEKTVLCSLDKDLDMIPGDHYAWRTGKIHPEPFWNVSVLEGIRWFFRQMLTGDPVDNILGLHGVGEKSSHVKKLWEMENSLDMHTHVFDLYEKRFGSYADTFFEENAALLWMRRTDISICDLGDIDVASSAKYEEIDDGI